MSIRNEITAEVSLPLSPMEYEESIECDSTKEDKDNCRNKDKDNWVKKVKAEFQKQSKHNLPPELGELVFELPANRLNSNSNRSYFVKTIAESILLEQNRIEEWAEYEPLIVQLALCSEIMISVQYYHNYIFDGKNGVNTPLLIRETLIKSNLLKSWLFDYIDRVFSHSGYDKLISKEVNEAFDKTDTGQFIEGRYNKYAYFNEKKINNDILDYYFVNGKAIDWDVIDDCINIVKKDCVYSISEYLFLQLYFLRLYLISTALYKTSVNILINFFNVNETYADRLIKFSSYYGIMMQVVNDTIDFIPGYMDHDTKSKYPQDQQNDIRNKNFTLPLFLLFHYDIENKSNVKSVLDSSNYKGYSERLERKIFEEIKPVLAQHTIPIGESIAKRAQGCLNSFKFLSLLNIASDNRFYRIILRSKTNNSHDQ